MSLGSAGPRHLGRGNSWRMRQQVLGAQVPEAARMAPSLLRVCVIGIFKDASYEFTFTVVTGNPKDRLIRYHVESEYSQVSKKLFRQ